MDILIIADDLTGANDTNVQFAKFGARAITCYDLRSLALYPGFDIASLSTESRSLTPENAYQKAATVIRRLPFQPEYFVYKKIDSALRGSFGIEIDALMDNMPWIKATLVAAAYPDNHRTTINGSQLVKGVPVHQTEIAADPVTPVTDSNLLTVLGSQSRRKIGYLPLAQVLKGYPAVQSYIHSLISDHCEIIVADAETNEHLSTLARVIWDEKSLIPCGSAGLALALAEIYRQRSDWQQTKSINPSPFLAVVGSKSDVAGLQVTTARQELPNIRMLAIDTDNLVDSSRAGAQMDRAVTAALRIFAQERFLVLYLSSKVMHQSTDAPIIASGLAEIACRILQQVKIKTLFATGGDTAAHIFDKLGIQALELENELEPGICKGRFVGGTYDGLGVITKAGSFGDAHTLVRIIKNIH